ncbi:MAG: inorganic phosphate transporter [Phycisphaerae bacterium]
MAPASLQSLSPFHLVCLFLAVTMLLWDTIEVGRNDAANLVNAVLGARVLRRRQAILIAGAAVVAGAFLSSKVIDTARKGIFDPTGLNTLEAALSIYISVYIVDTVLYSYSAFGMPVSTTACLVFELLGAALAIEHSTVNWGKAGTVVAAIVVSIMLSGFAAFLIQRAARGALRDRTASLAPLLLHGGWIGGGLAAGLFYFLLLKGMKHVAWVKHFNQWLNRLDENSGMGVGSAFVVFFMWGVFAILIHLTLVVFRRRAAKLLFPTLAIVGMVAMAFAFGQNDLANCASPGLSALALIRAQNLELGTKVNIDSWMLLLCGLLLFAGMTTKNADRVTKAAISTGSMGDRVALWAPQWCMGLAERVLAVRSKAPALAPRAALTATGKTVHFDTLRACVIMSVSASVIATASSLGLPVSTTYVAFAAVVATGLADRIFQRGDAVLKVGRAIWVVTSWFLSALIAVVATGLVATALHQLSIIGVVACVFVNLCVRQFLKRRADAQEKRVEEAADERAHPEWFALEEEDA